MNLKLGLERILHCECNGKVCLSRVNRGKEKKIKLLLKLGLKTLNVPKTDLGGAKGSAWGQKILLGIYRLF